MRSLHYCSDNTSWHCDNSQSIPVGLYLDRERERDLERDLEGLREGLRLPERDRERDRDIDRFDAALLLDLLETTLAASDPLPEKLLPSESDMFSSYCFYETIEDFKMKNSAKS